MIDQNWEGSTEKFADLVAKLASEKGLIANDQIPTVRLVRDYVSRGILSKPRKEGKEVVFGYIQLIEFLACRALIKDGWPLKKIAEDFQRSSPEEIKILVPGETQENSSLKLIKSFSSKIQPATNLNTTDRLFNKPDYSAEALSENSSSLSSDSPSIEPFFQTTELDYFRKILISRRDNLLKKREIAEAQLRLEEKISPLDNLDDKNKYRRLLDMRRAKDRLGRMLSEVQTALERMKNGTYGICVETGNRISIEQLEKNPTETLSLEAKNNFEQEKTHSPFYRSQSRYNSIRQMAETNLRKMESLGRSREEVIKSMISREPFTRFARELIRDLLGERTFSRPRFKENAIERQMLEEVSRSLGKSNSRFPVKEFTNIEITNSISVQIENSELKKITRDQAKAIAQAIELNLINAKIREDNKDD